MNLTLLVLVLASVAADSEPVQPRAKVCNGMKIDVSGISIDDAYPGEAVPSLVHPGDCAVLPVQAAGAYRLRFIERSAQGTAICVREISLKPGAVIQLTPDDHSECLQ